MDNNENSISEEPEQNVARSMWRALWSKSFLTALTIAVAITNLGVPYLESIFQDKSATEHKREELVATLSTTTTKTINFIRAYKEYSCQSRNETDEILKQKNKQLAFDYFEKLNALDPPYEAVCAIIKIHFSPQVNIDISNYKRSLEAYIRIPFGTTTKDGRCEKNSEFDIKKNEAWDQHNKLLEKLVMEINN
jgi:hypothetical protein